MYVESKIKTKQQTSEYNNKKKRSRVTDIENKLVVTSGEKEEEEGQ